MLQLSHFVLASNNNEIKFDVLMDDILFNNDITIWSIQNKLYEIKDFNYNFDLIVTKLDNYIQKFLKTNNINNIIDIILKKYIILKKIIFYLKDVIHIENINIHDDYLLLVFNKLINFESFNKDLCNLLYINDEKILDKLNKIYLNIDNKLEYSVILNQIFISLAKCLIEKNDSNIIDISINIIKNITKPDDINYNFGKKLFDIICEHIIKNKSEIIIDNLDKLYHIYSTFKYDFDELNSFSHNYLIEKVDNSILNNLEDILNISKLIARIKALYAINNFDLINESIIFWDNLENRFWKKIPKSTINDISDFIIANYDNLIHMKNLIISMRNVDNFYEYYNLYFEKFKERMLKNYNKQILDIEKELFEYIKLSIDDPFLISDFESCLNDLYNSVELIDELSKYNIIFKTEESKKYFDLDLMNLSILRINKWDLNNLKLKLKIPPLILPYIKTIETFYHNKYQNKSLDILNDQTTITFLINNKKVIGPSISMYLIYYLEECNKISLEEIYNKILVEITSDTKGIINNHLEILIKNGLIKKDNENYIFINPSTDINLFENNQTNNNVDISEKIFYNRKILTRCYIVKVIKKGQKDRIELFQAVKEILSKYFDLTQEEFDIELDFCLDKEEINKSECGKYYTF